MTILRRVMRDPDYRRPSRDEALRLVEDTEPEALLTRAATLRDAGFGRVVTYSRKVFIPLTTLCRDVCHYCTFAQPPRAGEPAYLTIDEAVDIARRGAEAGCREALFTLGDKPERRYPQAAREALVGARASRRRSAICVSRQRELVLDGRPACCLTLNPGDGQPGRSRGRCARSVGVPWASCSRRSPTGLLARRGRPTTARPDKVPDVGASRPCGWPAR